MENVLDNGKGSLNCFLCSSELSDDTNSWMLFENRLSEDGVPMSPLSDILIEVLGKKLEEDTVHSKIICDPCCNTLLEYELCKNRLDLLKLEILKWYENSMMLSKLSEPVTSNLESDLSLKVISSSKGNLKSVPNIRKEEEYSSQIHLSNEKENSLLKVTEGTIHKDFLFTTEEILEENNIQFSLENPIKSSNNVNILNKFNGKSVTIKIPINSIIFQTNNAQSLKIFSGEKVETSKSPSFDAEKGEESVAEEVYRKSGENYLCLTCGSSDEFDAKSFVEHMRLVHNHTFLNCEYCMNSFVRKKDLLDHLETVHIEEINFEKLTCSQCQTICDNATQLKQHMQAHKQYDCKICSKKCNSKALLDEHMNKHTGQRPFICEKCSKGFTSKYTLQAHLRTHMERARPYTCDTCKKSFYNQQHLKQHIKLHSNIGAVSCEVCSKSFSTQHNLNLHMVVHSNNKPYECKICGKTFARKPEIKNHERTHSGERPFKCDLCPMAFAQRSNLTSHKKSTHFNEKQHQCEICSRSFKRRRLLDYHIQSVHTGERPHKCSVCDAAFVYPEHLKKHVLIHSGKKPFACEICGKTFSSRENRNAHRFVHSDKKLYECMECGSGFMRKPLLLAHMKQTNHENDSIIINQPRFDNDKDSSSFIEDIDDFESNVDFNFIEVISDKCLDQSNQVLSCNEVKMVCDNNNKIGDDNDVGELVKEELNNCVNFLDFQECEQIKSKSLTGWEELILKKETDII